MAIYEKSVIIEGGWKAVFNARECTAPLQSEVEKALGSPRMPEDWTLVGSSSTSRVWKFRAAGESEKGLEGKGKWYVFKEFLPRGSLESLKARVRGTRAERAWRGGGLLAERGFLTPPLVAWGVKLRGGFPTARNFLVTGFVPGVSGLFTFLRDRFNTCKGDDRFYIKRRLAIGLGSTIGRMHSGGVIHGDLRLDNIMVTMPEGWGAQGPRFYFIDNERNAVFKKATLKLIIKNLVQVNMVLLPCVTRSDRMRFYLAYLSNNSAMLPLKKTLAAEVWAKTMERLGKKSLFAGRPIEKK
ncbi:MAG: hypothetical protein HY890_00650, partial [Deltaproteobacteria bacterium]|nr:hypothetical protein [Deltaproteobacteria bacterium]